MKHLVMLRKATFYKYLATEPALEKPVSLSLVTLDIQTSIVKRFQVTFLAWFNCFIVTRTVW